MNNAGQEPMMQTGDSRDSCDFVSGYLGSKEKGRSQSVRPGNGYVRSKELDMEKRVDSVVIPTNFSLTIIKLSIACIMLALAYGVLFYLFPPANLVTSSLMALITVIVLSGMWRAIYWHLLQADRPELIINEKGIYQKGLGWMNWSDIRSVHLLQSGVNEDQLYPFNELVVMTKEGNPTILFSLDDDYLPMSVNDVYQLIQRYVREHHLPVTVS